MKIINIDERVHVLDSRSNVWSIINDIVDTGLQEDAFYICNIGDIVRQHTGWKAALPRVEPFYAVKCNDSKAVLEVLAALGTGFDCASKTEINKVMQLGVDSSRIIFANPAKPASHIRHAASVGVAKMTFDNEAELYKIRDLYPNARLVIRIRCDAEDAQCQLGMKFGCDAINEAPRLLQLAKSLDLNVIGVSFHVGSGCREPAVFKRAIAAARDIFDYAQQQLGWAFDLLDIGGGYPGGKGTSFEKIADIINNALDDYFPDQSKVRVIAEPGRYYVSSAYTLACNIHSIRDVIPRDRNTSAAPPSSAVGAAVNKLHRMYYINDGVYGSFNCILYDHQHVVPIPLKETPQAAYYSSSIWGPTCDGLDQVVEEVMLPDMKIGDWIVFEDMGAYTLPVASPFNGFPVPKVHFVVEENLWRVMKDTLSLTEDHLVVGTAPSIANGGVNNKQTVGIDLSLLAAEKTKRREERAENFILPQFPIKIPVYRNDGTIEEMILDYSEPKE